MPFEKELQELKQKKARALQMGGRRRLKSSMLKVSLRPGKGSTGFWIPAHSLKWVC